VGALLASDLAVEADELVHEVGERFFRTPQLQAVAVVRQRKPVGLLTRGRLLLKLARGFGHELYGRKPVARIADNAPLIVSEQCSVEEAIALALRRDPTSVYDEIVVIDRDGCYLGLLPVRDLIVQQSIAYARRTAEHDAALERSRDLEKLDRLRSQFLAHATHELRSPVNAIAALAELIRDSGTQSTSPTVGSRLTMLVQCTATLRTTVNNLLDLSRLEAGRTELALSDFSAGELLEEVATTARLLVGQKPVLVKVETPGELWLQTDRNRLRQVLVNLASNAAKFTDQGEIVLAVERHVVSWCLTVRDTGCGISNEDLARLFVPFGQLEDALTKAHEGTGLGLVISRSLAKLLGGRIEVTSKVGMGSAFSVYLPIPKDQEVP